MKANGFVCGCVVCFGEFGDVEFEEEFISYCRGDFMRVGNDGVNFEVDVRFVVSRFFRIYRV